jgi:hypothetical protein
MYDGEMYFFAKIMDIPLMLQVIILQHAEQVPHEVVRMVQNVLLVS